jgi:hypothetical protein
VSDDEQEFVLPSCNRAVRGDAHLAQPFPTGAVPPLDRLLYEPAAITAA